MQCRRHPKAVFLLLGVFAYAALANACSRIPPAHSEPALAEATAAAAPAPSDSGMKIAPIAPVAPVAPVAGQLPAPEVPAMAPRSPIPKSDSDVGVAPTPLPEIGDPTSAKPRGLLDYQCAVAADCEVKDVGNCCGHMPACVNRASIPDSAQVQADCAKEGRSGICGFQELSGCQCVESRCVGIPAGAGGGGDVR